MFQTRASLRVLVVVVVLAVSGCSDDKPQPSDSAADITTTTTVLSGYDAPFESFTAEGVFTADLPGTPSMATQEATTPLGPVPLDIYLVEGPDGAIGVAVNNLSVDVASLDTAHFLDATVEGVADAIGGSVESQSDVDGASLTRDGVIAATTQGQDIVMFVRVIVVGNDLFQLQSLGLAAGRSAVEADFERLVASFVPLT